MGKLLHGKTIITIENQYTGRDRYETSSVSVSSIDRGKTYQIGVGRATQLPDTDLLPPFGENETAPDDERKKLIESHASVLTDVLKQIETTRLNAAIRREKLEEELAAQERANLVTLRFGVHNAIQAGLSTEEVTASMEDGRANLVEEAFNRVYDATDLHTDAGMK